MRMSKETLHSSNLSLDQYPSAKLWEDRNQINILFKLNLYTVDDDYNNISLKVKYMKMDNYRSARMSEWLKGSRGKINNNFFFKILIYSDAGL